MNNFPIKLFLTLSLLCTACTTIKPSCNRTGLLVHGSRLAAKLAICKFNPASCDLKGIAEESLDVARRAKACIDPVVRSSVNE